MTEAEYKNQETQGEVHELEQPEQKFPEQESLNIDFDIYLTVLEAMQRPKRHITTAPTFTPRNFLEQIQFYDDEAGTERIYFYVNGNWKYSTLT